MTDALKAPAPTVTAEEVLYVPVTNINYLPEGIVALQGATPEPVTDKVLTGIKNSLEAQGHVSGDEAQELNPSPENPEPEPPAADDEATEPEPEPAAAYQVP